MNEMIERVAKALLEDKFPPNVGIALRWDQMNAYERSAWMRAARVAIETMREPTEAMLNAAGSLGFCREEDVIEIWGPMIDAALRP
jgi:hypothetical protein